jgi:magnesium-transporting ATPase (P-type)
MLIFFLSDRKRMSVIIRTSQDKIKLYCKGADSVIMERLEPNDQNAQLTSEHLENFANDGLRTLCVAYRTLDEEEYKVNINRKSIVEKMSGLGMVGEVSRSIDSDQ